MADSAKRATDQYVMCVSNDGFEASLEVRKIYRALADRKAARRSLVRVIDESGEAYLFPAELFVDIEIPEAAVPAFSTGS